MSDIVKQQSKRFQRIFGNLPKQYGYCVTTENGISIVRDCKDGILKLLELISTLQSHTTGV